MDELAETLKAHYAARAGLQADAASGILDRIDWKQVAEIVTLIVKLLAK